MMPLLDFGREGIKIPFECVDMHGHLGRYFFAIPDMSLESLIASMDRVGIRRYWTSHMRTMSADADWGNEQVFAAMKKYPNRILGAISVWPSSKSDVKRVVEKWLRKGFSGFKLHNSNGFPYTHDNYEFLYKTANERKMPILFHTWGGDNEFREISSLAAKYPMVSFLMAHSGSAAKEGYVKMAKEYPNIYLDLTLSRSPRGMVEYFVAEVGAEKVVWGSDAIFMSNTQQVGKVLGAKISDSEKRKILGGNAVKILCRAEISAIS